MYKQISLYNPRIVQKHIIIYLFCTLLFYIPDNIEAQVKTALIDSTEYEFYQFPIVYNEVDEFEGIEITYTSRVDPWLISINNGIISNIWLSKFDDQIILNTLSGFDACITDKTNLKIKLRSDEIIELPSLNQINCENIKIMKFLIDDAAISKIINSEVETVRFSTTEGIIDFKPVFADDRYISSLEYHERELSDANITEWSINYHNESILSLESDFEKGYKGNRYNLIHINSATFKTSICGLNGDYYESKLGDHHGMLDDLFYEFEVSSCKELVAFYNEDYDILGSLLITLLNK